MASTTSKYKMKILGITDGSAGMVAQIVALAEALGLQAEMKVISIPKPLRYLPNLIFDFFPFLYSFLPAFPSLKPEAQTLIISCGRKAALVAASLRKQAKNTKVIHIQDPQMSPDNFDLVVAMAHDKIIGENVIKTKFALHNITPEKLAVAAQKFAPVFASYPKPQIAVLLGGSTNKYTLTPARMQALIAALQQVQGSLLITTSRRTGADNIASLKAAFAGNSKVYIYDATDKQENPYMGLLACADEIIVTNDSVNMMTEAYMTEKNVTILPLLGHKNTKPAKFAEMIQKEKLTGNEMQNLAAEIKKMVDF